jgi:hypothetical protein
MIGPSLWKPVNVFNSLSRSATVPAAAGTFSPLRMSLRLDEHQFSPNVIKMIAEAVGKLHSDAQAATALQLAKIPISLSQIQRIARQVGQEMIQERDKKVELRRKRQLPVRVDVTPEVVAVEVDGGRLRTRASQCGLGVHEVQGKEDKVACLVTLQSQRLEHDPQPEPPPSFRQPRRVRRLVTAMKGLAAECENRPENPAEVEHPEQSEPTRSTHYNGHPKKLVRTCVSSMASSDEFGPMMAVEAQERGFYQAKRRAFVSDGAKYNWSIHRGYFANFEPIVDFLHVLCYIYRAAWMASNSDAERWSTYETWLRKCWEGRVGEVIEQLQVVQERLGIPPEEETLDPNDPRRVVAEALSYLTNNQKRMDYPRYRQEGLPITSSLVESLVGEFNARVKSRQKFWNRPDGAEPILQLRAAVLSEDDQLNRFFEKRPGNSYRSRKAA